jgi:hypothetical protein
MQVLEAESLLLCKLQELPRANGSDSEGSDEEGVRSLNFVMIVNPKPKYEDLCAEYRMH